MNIIHNNRKPQQMKIHKEHKINSIKFRNELIAELLNQLILKHVYKSSEINNKHKQKSMMN